MVATRAIIVDISGGYSVSVSKKQRVEVAWYMYVVGDVAVCMLFEEIIFDVENAAGFAGMERIVEGFGQRVSLSDNVVGGEAAISELRKRKIGFSFLAS